MKRLRLLLAVGHAGLGQAIAEVIRSMAEVVLVATVGTGNEVMPISRELKPDVILLDFRLPELSGLEVANLIKRQLPETRAVILLDEEEEKYIEAVERSAAWGYLVKSQLTEKLPALLFWLRTTSNGEAD